MLRTSALFLSAAILLPAQNGGPVEGVVVNRVTGVGIGGVTVVLYTREAIQYEATTDDYGHFVTTRMEPGVYQVRYEKPRFKQFREDPASPYRVGARKDYRDRPYGAGLRLEMTPLVTLRGRVLNGDGKPALRAQVRMGSFFAFVDARGEFEFDRMEPGSYTLMAEPGPSPPTESRIEPVRTAFPQRVVVRGDKDLSGYEIQLQSVPMHRVRGVVRDETGRPVLASLRLLDVVQRGRQVITNPGSDYFAVVGPEQGDGLLQASTTSAEDGSFEFPSVPSGEWRIAVDAGMRRGEARMSIAQSDIDALQIRVSVPAIFNMNVTVDWGGAPPAASLSLLGRTLLVPDRAMRLENLRPGRYRVMPSTVQGYYPVSARLGRREVLGESVDLNSGLPELRIVYKAASGSVSGTAPAGSTIVLLPKQVPAFGRIARSNSTNASFAETTGFFSITGVAPGEYYVSAFEGFDASYLTDRDLLRKIAADGASVTVATSPVAAPALTALKWPE